MKLLCMGLVVLIAKDHPLVTVGDAAASFLSVSDPTTEGLGLITKDIVQKKQKYAKKTGFKSVLERSSVPYDPKPLRSSKAVTKCRRWGTLSL